MINVNSYVSFSNTQNTQTNSTQNTQSNKFSTDLLLALMGEEAQTTPQSNTTTDYATYPSGDSLVSVEFSETQDKMKSFLEGNNGKFTTTIDWSSYESSLSKTQIATLKSQFGGELTLLQYADAMKAIARLESAKVEEDEILEEMSEEIVSSDIDTVETATIQSNYSAEFIDSLNFYDIDKNTEFYNSDTNLFNEFELSLVNKNYDYVNFMSLLGEKDNDKFKVLVEEDASAQISDNTKVVSIEQDSPLNLNKYGGFSHLTPIIIQDIKTEIEELKKS